MRGTWQTNGGGGGRVVEIAVAVIVIVAGVAILPAIVELAHALVVIAIVTAAVAAAGGLAVLAWRLYALQHPPAARMVQAAPWRPQVQAQLRPEVIQAQPLALPAPRPRADGLHLHFHGVSADEVAEILDRHRPAG